MVDSSPVMDNWTGRTRRHVTPSALPRLACCALLRHDTRGTQLTARRLKVGTDEPVEQLKLVQVTDQQVVGDGIYLVGVLSSPAVARDDALVGEIECTEVVERTRTPDRVVVRTAIPLATGGGLRVSLLGGSLSASTGLSNRPRRRSRRATLEAGAALQPRTREVGHIVVGATASRRSALRRCGRPRGCGVVGRRLPPVWPSGTGVGNGWSGALTSGKTRVGSGRARVVDRDPLTASTDPGGSGVELDHDADDDDDPNPPIGAFAGASTRSRGRAT